MPDAYKTRYRVSIWRQFEDALRAASYTNSLGKFVTSLCSALNSDIRAGEIPGVTAALRECDDRTALRLIRDETTYLVAMVRDRKQTEHQNYAAWLEEGAPEFEEVDDEDTAA